MAQGQGLTSTQVAVRKFLIVRNIRAADTCYFDGNL
jgi:hypothetical protein